MNLSGNTILITGGATGIGFSMAVQFLEQGNEVIICGRRQNRLQEAKNKYPQLHIKVCDVTKQEEREHLAGWIIQTFPEFNMLINNAGIQLETNLSDAQIVEQVHREVETNFVAPIHLSALFIPYLRGKENAAIVNITSGLAFAPLAIVPVYCATKAALHSLTLSLRHQLKDTGIKVFEIAPPMVDTELDQGARDNRSLENRGISPEEFTQGAMEALRNDTFEAAIGMAENLRQKRETMFPIMNR